MAESDAALIKQIANGDRGAFLALYDRHAPRVLGLLTAMLRDRATAEDALQDTFLTVWNKAGQFDESRANAAGWLALIARSRGVDQLRKKRRLGSEIPDVPQVAEPSADMQTAERASAALKALQSLSDDQRSAVALAFYGGLTHEAIARQTGVPLGTVKTRIRLAMRKLRDTLAPIHGVQAK